MHRQTFAANEMDGIDRTLCQIESLGSVIARLSRDECEPIDRSVMADLGDLVSEKASALVEQIGALPESEPPA